MVMEWGCGIISLPHPSSDCQWQLNGVKFGHLLLAIMCFSLLVLFFVLTTFNVLLRYYVGSKELEL